MNSNDAVAPDSRHRGEVYEAFADRSLGPEAAIERALSAGRRRLGVELGFLTRIEDGTQRIVRAVGSHDHIRAGGSCPLDRAYCRRTVQSEGLLSVQDAAASALVDDVAYETFGLDSYIGCKVVVDDEPYGTVCFADETERDRPFTEAEQLFVELVARLSGRAIERRQYEDRLRERTDRVREEKRRLQGITETTFDIIYRVDAAAEFTYVSSAAERIVGYTPEEMLGTPFAEYVTPRSLPAALRTYESVMSGDPAQGAEIEFEHAGGGTVVLEHNTRPVYGEGADDGEVVAVQGVARDVTARKEQERELRLSNRAIDEASLAISIADASDPTLPIIYANDAFAELTGFDGSEILGENWRRLAGPGTELDQEAFVRNIRTGESVTDELLAYRKDGTPFWTRATVTPVADEEGAVTHLIGFQEDITERKRTERLVELLNRVLRHNLRNDMNVLAGYAELLGQRSGGSDGDGESELTDVIRRTAADLLELSENARELEAVARQDRTPARLDPAAVVERAVDPLRSDNPEASIEVSVATDRAVCAGAELERAMAELVGNALRHDPSPSTRVAVTVRDGDDGEAVEIRVDDDGPGLPEMEAEVVENGHESPLEHGNGLGLWLVNWIVTRYGGSFQIRATPDGSGTVATLRLPAIGPDETVEAVARPPTALFR